MNRVFKIAILLALICFISVYSAKNKKEDSLKENNSNAKEIKQE
jgi:uncharacterized membrane protein